MKGLDLEGIKVKELKLKGRTVFKTTTFLSFIYIVKGKGNLLYDERYIDFTEGKLFIIPQQETYRFESENADLISIECPIGFIDKIRLEADRIESCENLYKLQYISNNYHSRADVYSVMKTMRILRELLFNRLPLNSGTGQRIILSSETAFRFSLI